MTNSTNNGKPPTFIGNNGSHGNGNNGHNKNDIDSALNNNFAEVISRVDNLEAAVEGLKDTVGNLGNRVGILDNKFDKLEEKFDLHRNDMAKEFRNQTRTVLFAVGGFLISIIVLMASLFTGLNGYMDSKIDDKYDGKIDSKIDAKKEDFRNMIRQVLQEIEAKQKPLIDDTNSDTKSF